MNEDDKDEKARISAEIDELRDKMRQKEISPREAAEAVLNIAKRATAVVGEHEITVPTKAALYALGHGELADSLRVVAVTFMPTFGMAVTFGVEPGSFLADMGVGRPEDLVNHGSTEAKAIHDAIIHVMSALGFETHLHEDGSVHLSGHQSIRSKVDIEAQVAAFSAEIDAFDRPPPDPGSVMGRWG